MLSIMDATDTYLQGPAQTYHREYDDKTVGSRRINGLPLWMYVLDKYIKQRGYRIK